MNLRIVIALAYLAAIVNTSDVAVGCSVCGEGMEVGDPDGLFIFPGQPVVQCGLLESAGETGQVTDEECGLLSRLIQEACACQIADDPTLAPFAPALMSPPPATAPVAPAGGGNAASPSPSETPICPICGDGLMVGNRDAILSFSGQPQVSCGVLEDSGLANEISPSQCSFLPNLIVETCECGPPSCSVCGDGLSVGNPDAIFSFPGQPVLTCEQLQEAGTGGLIDPSQCSFLPSLIVGTCECGPEGPTTNAPITFAPVSPTAVPSFRPTSGTDVESDTPSQLPSIVPSVIPSLVPSLSPSSSPSVVGVTSSPTVVETLTPTSVPTSLPTNLPTSLPTGTPTILPTSSPTETEATASPTTSATASPTAVPTAAPTQVPTKSPSVPLSPSPSETPETDAPTDSPTTRPSQSPKTDAPAETPIPSQAPITFAPVGTPVTGPVITPTSESCNVCGEGKQVGNPDGMVVLPGEQPIRCDDLEAAGQIGVIGPTECRMLPNIISGICECDFITPSVAPIFPSTSAPFAPATLAPFGGGDDDDDDDGGKGKGGKKGMGKKMSSKKMKSSKSSKSGKKGNGKKSGKKGNGKKGHSGKKSGTAPYSVPFSAPYAAPVSPPFIAPLNAPTTSGKKSGGKKGESAPYSEPVSAPFATLFSVPTTSGKKSGRTPNSAPATGPVISPVFFGGEKEGKKGAAKKGSKAEDFVR